MRISIFIGMALLLAACGEFMGAGAQHYRAANGKDTYALTCTGAMVSMDNCVETAGELCPDGYVTLDGGPQKGDLENRKEYLDNPKLARHMTVQCKQAH